VALKYVPNQTTAIILYHQQSNSQINTDYILIAIINAKLAIGK
jgi:hypothetical protein